MKRILLLSAFSISIFISSCKKETPDTETQSAVDNSVCQNGFSQIMPTANAYAVNEMGVRGVMSGCPTITVDPADTTNGFPVTMIIDFGTSCYDSIDGKTRSGQLKCTFSNRWHIIGTTITVKLINYVVDGNAYSADSIIISHDAANTFTTKTVNGKCVTSGATMEWAGTHIVTQTDGMTTPLNHNDDVFSFTGSAAGKNRNGVIYTSKITTAIVKRATCAWAESGRLDIIPSGMATRTVDFGDGTCDNKATLTINGNVFTFTMN